MRKKLTSELNKREHQRRNNDARAKRSATVSSFHRLNLAGESVVGEHVYVAVRVLKEPDLICHALGPSLLILL